MCCSEASTGCPFERRTWQGLALSVTFWYMRGIGALSVLTGFLVVSACSLPTAAMQGVDVAADRPSATDAPRPGDVVADVPRASDLVADAQPDLLSVFPDASRDAAAHDSAAPADVQLAVDTFVAPDLPRSTVTCGSSLCLSPSDVCCFNFVAANACVGAGMCQGVPYACDDPTDCPTGQICCRGLLGSACNTKTSCDQAGLDELCQQGAQCSDHADNCCPLASPFDSYAVCRPTCS